MIADLHGSFVQQLQPQQMNDRSIVKHIDNRIVRCVINGFVTVKTCWYLAGII